MAKLIIFKQYTFFLKDFKLHSIVTLKFYCVFEVIIIKNQLISNKKNNRAVKAKTAGKYNVSTDSSDLA